MGFLIILSDLIALIISAALSIVFYSALSGEGDTLVNIQRYFLPLTVSILILFGINKLYKFHGYVSMDEFKSITIHLFYTHFVISIIALFLGESLTNLWILFPNFLTSLLLVMSFRFSIKHKLAQNDLWKLPVVVIGNKEDVEPIIDLLKRSRRLFMLPVHVLTFSTPKTEIIRGIPVDQFSYENCLNLSNKGIEIAVVLQQNTRGFDHNEKIYWTTQVFKEMYLVYGRIMLGSVSNRLANLAGYPSIVFQNPFLQRRNLIIKRMTDFLISGVFLIFFWPIYIIIGILVWLDSGRPITFLQERMGKDGQLFKVHKFRSMQPGSKEQLEVILTSSSKTRSDYTKYRKIKNDPRITRFGKIMRKFSLDELPQIVNILKGEMSIIGPRPYTLDEIDPNDPDSQKILSVLPGITGWWQVMGRNATTFEERRELDKYYVSNWSLWIDAYILFKTIWVVISGTGR